MREGWKKKLLGDICKINSGKTIKANEIHTAPNKELVPCYGGNGIRGYVKNVSHDGIFPIVGRVGALCGNVHLANGRFYATEHALVFTLKDNSAEPHFLAQLLKAKKLGQYAKGVAQPVISAGELSKLSIIIPPKSTQLAIVSELDKINELIRLKKEQLVEYDNLAQSIFYEMFGDPVENEKGWEVKKLIDVCTKITDGKHGGCTILPESEFFFVGAREITNDSVNYRTAQHISEAEFNKDYARCNVEIGDLLLVNTGATIGKSAIAKDKRSTKTLLQKSVALLKVNKKYLTAPYLQYCYKMNQHMYQVSGASAQANLLLSQIKKTEILLPPLPLQQSFASRIEQIEKLKSEVQNAITDLETLLASRMQYWFE